MQSNRVRTQRVHAGGTMTALRGSARWQLRLAAATIVLFLSLGMCHSGQAAPKQDKSTQDLQSDIYTLKEQITILSTQQKQILDQLNALKQLIASQPAAAAPAPSAAPTPPPLPASLPLTGLPMEGDNNAHVAVIEYTDFECPFCRRYAADTYPQIYANYVKTGKIRYYYHDFPLGFHAHAMPNAQAAHCAAEQGKFWEMHDVEFTDPLAASDDDLMTKAKSIGLDTDKFAACLKSQKFTNDIQDSINEGNKIGVNATPTFYIGTVAADGSVVNVDKQVLGAEPYDNFKSAIDAELAPKA
jgi:protein-disulfide isomerase